MAKTCVIVMIVFLIAIIFYEKTEIFSIKIKIYQTDEEIKRYIFSKIFWFLIVKFKILKIV